MTRPAFTGSLVRLAAGSRIALGVAVLARPEMLVRAMRVDAATARRTAWLSRMLGARDLALGLGTLLVLTRGGEHRPWLMASGFADAVDAAAVDLPGRSQPSITDKVPLLGADGYHALVNQADHLAAEHGLHPYRVRHLLDRYGSLVHEVLTLAEGRPELLKPIEHAPDYLGVEVVYAASHEGALHLEDVLARRTRISIEYAHRGVDCAEQVAGLVGEVLGWSPETVKREVDLYAARVEAERESQSQPSDEAADALRSAAPEARAGLIEPVG